MRKISIAALTSLFLLTGFGSTALAQDDSVTEKADPEGAEPEQTLLAQQQEKPSKSKDEEYRSLIDKARQKYQAEDYIGAIALLKQARELKKDPQELYKIGRIYEKMGKFENAVDYYKRFAKAPDISQEQRKEALGRIKTLREVAELDEDQQEEHAQATQAPEIMEGPKEPVMEPNYTPTWIMVPTGVALLAGGVVATIVASGKAHDLEDGQANNSLTEDEEHHLQDSVSTWNLTSYVLYGVGGVSLAGGIYLWASPPMTEVSPSKTAGLRIGPPGDGFSVGMTWKF